MFIQTEETPNPQTLKFLPGREVMAQGTADFPNIDAAKQSPLAQKLFGIEGVAGVFFGHDFISITKEEDRDWMVLKPSVLGSIMEFFMSHDQVEVKKEESDPEKKRGEPSGKDVEIIEEITTLIETHVRPAVAQDGGDITFEKFEDGVVYLQLKGACSGCPSSTLTLKSGIENMLKHYIPEVQEVRAL